MANTILGIGAKIRHEYFSLFSLKRARREPRERVGVERGGERGGERE